MGLVGILVALGLLIWLAYRGWSILLLAPAAAVLAAGLAGEPLLAHWTQTFMGSAARFIMQFFPIFLLGALFGKLMEDRPLRGNLLRGSNYAEVVEASGRAMPPRPPAGASPHKWRRPACVITVESRPLGSDTPAMACPDWKAIATILTSAQEPSSLW